MLGSIALLVLFALAVAGAFVQYRGRHGRDSWRFLRDLSPVSGPWLADYRRSG
jgi:hypothetical protein